MTAETELDAAIRQAAFNHVRWLKDAAAHQIPIIYFVGISPGRYRAEVPTYITGWDGAALNARVEFGDRVFGQPISKNGIPLSKIHHADSNAHLIGIDQDYRLHVSKRLLEQKDGPMLKSRFELFKHVA
jgi:hypothetical protein